MKLKPVHLKINVQLSDSPAIEDLHCSLSLNTELDFLALYVEADVVGLWFSGVDYL